MLVLRQQDAQVKTGPPVEEAQLQNVHVEPAQKRPRGHARPDAMLDPAATLDRAIPDAKLDHPLGDTLLDAENFLGFQRAVLVVLGDEMLEAAAVVMLHLALEIANVAADDHVLVHLPFFIAGLAVAEKAHVPAWVIAAVVDALAEENQVAVDVKAVFLAVVSCRDSNQLITKAGRDQLIGIENKNPGRFDGQVIKPPVFLTGITLPGVINERSAI